MENFDWYMFFWTTEQPLQCHNFITEPPDPYVCPTLQPTPLPHSDPIALQAYQHLLHIFYHHRSIQVQQHLSLHRRQYLSLQDYQHVSRQAHQLLWRQVDDYLSRKYGPDYIYIYYHHPLRQRHFLASHFSSSDSSTATTLPCPHLSSRSGPWAPYASTATPPYHPEQRAVHGLGEPMHFIDALDHPPPTTRISPLERSYYLHGVSEQFNQASTHLSSASRELDDDNHDLEASFPYDPSSQAECPAILLPRGTENEDIFWARSPVAQDDYGSQPHDEFDAQDSSYHQQALGTPTPSDDASIFTEELVTEFQVNKRPQTQTQGRIPCFMCRQKFSNNRQALRHMKQCHFLNMIWVCKTGSCADYQTDTPKHRLLPPGSRGNIFFRRDNFTSHAVVKHGVADELKKDLARQAEVDRYPLPTELSCSVPGCEARYVGGYHVLGDLLTHVTKDHPAELEGTAFRNALLPYLHSIKIVFRGPRGLRPVTHEDSDSG